MDDESLAPQLITGSANMTVAGVRLNHENQSLFKFVEGSRAPFDAFRDQFEAMWNNQFIYPPGSSFDDYVPSPCRRA